MNKPHPRIISLEIQSLISIVITAYREDNNIPLIYDELIQVFHSIRDRYRYEIIFVNDGSPDRTWHAIEQLCDTDTHVKGVNLSRNFGKELAITAGLELSSGDVVITLDADGQHPVDKIPDFLHEYEAGYEIVYNRRPETRDASFLKRYSSRLFYVLFNLLSEFKLEPHTTDYRLLSRDVVDAYLQFHEKNRMYRGLVDWLGFEKKALVFNAKKRIHGEATYSYRRLLSLAINNLTSFSFFPLKFVGYFGLFVTVSSVCMLFLQMLDKVGILHF